MTDHPAQHIVTTNNQEGKAVFYSLPEKPKIVPSPYGWTTHIYTAPDLLPDVSSNGTADLESTAVHSQSGIAKMNGRICLDNGMTSAFLTLHPGAATPMHLTRTVDIGVIIEGEIELHLDGGDVRTLKPGDTFVQRGTNHQWKNVSDKDCRFFAFCVDAKTIYDGSGNVLEEYRL